MKLEDCSCYQRGRCFWLYEIHPYCKDVKECYYKQLMAKTEENKELRKQLDLKENKLNSILEIINENV